MQGKIKVVRKLDDELQCYCQRQEETVPSLFINPVKNVFNCFSCGEHGRASDLLNLYELDEAEAKIGPVFVPAAQIGEGTAGYQYMLKRGFQPQTLEEWGVTCTDQYVLIPFRTRKKGTVGLIYRYWEENKPKYRYNKGFQVHNYLFGTNLFVPSDFTLVVEGALDVMWLHQNGFRNTVAVMGTCLLEQQARLLRLLADRVCLSFDNDSAGQQATSKAIRLLMEEKLGIEVLQLPESVKDLKGLSAAELAPILSNNKISYLNYLISCIMNDKKRK
jgi:DNA primase